MEFPTISIKWGSQAERGAKSVFEDQHNLHELELKQMKMSKRNIPTTEKGVNWMKEFFVPNCLFTMYVGQMDEISVLGVIELVQIVCMENTHVAKYNTIAAKVLLFE